MAFTDAALLILLAALILDALIGDPDWLWARAPHPVVILGRGIGALDRRLNRAAWTPDVRRIAGVFALAVVMAATGLAGLGLHRMFAALPGGWLLESIAVSILLAQRSLWEHVARVRDAFGQGGLDEARRAVAMIVGRDPQSLDEAGVCRAAIETTAENFSDGVIAPALWYLAAGLPGIVIYKAANTADSMIGHRTPRYEAFGWAAARLDDVLNLMPARFAGLLLVLAAARWGKAGRALAAMWRDAPRHRSPNAGWPEAAMAGALGLALAGPRRYGGMIVADAWMNEGACPRAAPADIGRALRLYRDACLIFGGFIVVAAGL